jgi:hypothetical protein
MTDDREYNHEGTEYSSGVNKCGLSEEGEVD